MRIPVEIRFWRKENDASNGIGEEKAEVEATFISGNGGFLEKMPLQIEGRPTLGLTRVGLKHLEQMYGRDKIEAVVIDIVQD